VAFEVIPAIDVAGGRLVRLSAEGVVAVDAFGGDPVAAATAFVEAGAGRLHVVDVDLATTGEAANREVLRTVVGLGVPVQASGGVVTAAQVEDLLAAGAARVVLGSGALGARAEVERLVAGLGERLCVGVEADGGEIRPRGGGASLPLWETLVWLGGLDVPRFVFTEVARAGGLGGPDLDGIWALATHTGRPVLAAGGIRSLDDLRAVAALGGSVEGAIVGRALYEGLDPAGALRIGG
jgi:phosphoribosylformimino-5-aminoimidazole carboxamide ribotide isomerase